MLRNVGSSSANIIAQVIRDALAKMEAQKEEMKKSFNEAMALANKRTNQLDEKVKQATATLARTGKQSAENQKRTHELSEKLDRLEAKLSEIESQTDAVSRAAQTLKETTDKAFESAGNIDEKRVEFEEMYEQFKKKLAALLYVLGNSGETGRNSPDSFGGVQAASTSPVITVSPDSGKTGRDSPDSSSKDNDLGDKDVPTIYYMSYSDSDDNQEEEEEKSGFAPVELANSNLKW